MAKVKRQNPHGGAPRLGNAAPGEPADFPNAGDTAVGFGGSPTIAGQMNRGHKAVNPNPASEIHPAPYGGGNPFEKRPNQKSVKGGGANVGEGATSGTTQHGGAGIP